MSPNPPKPPLERIEYKVAGVSPEIEEYITHVERQNTEPQEVIDALANMCQSLRNKDIRAYGQFVKKVRRVLGDTDVPVFEENSASWKSVAGIMKDDPIWPQIMRLADNPSD